ncbi:hypothetical protein LAZ67_18001960 [Cordylochernes scorpioides]|uniref:Uncharacterized protein n=1 Tax=Cordylochernes scorpioides TaxID=51811 RepID=A0ABY6LG81_9ARAC|nr:hypothetical protein LAZ67_18001960 [Cordylochernes scorpioides]
MLEEIEGRRKKTSNELARRGQGSYQKLDIGAVAEILRNVCSSYRRRLGCLTAEEISANEAQVMEAYRSQEQEWNPVIERDSGVEESGPEGEETEVEDICDKQKSIDEKLLPYQQQPKEAALHHQEPKEKRKLPNQKALKIKPVPYRLKAKVKPYWQEFKDKAALFQQESNLDFRILTEHPSPIPEVFLVEEDDLKEDMDLDRFAAIPSATQEETVHHQEPKEEMTLPHQQKTKETTLPCPQKLQTLLCQQETNLDMRILTEHPTPIAEVFLAFTVTVAAHGTILRPTGQSLTCTASLTCHAEEDFWAGLWVHAEREKILKRVEEENWSFPMSQVGPLKPACGRPGTCERGDDIEEGKLVISSVSAGRDKTSVDQRTSRDLKMRAWHQGGDHPNCVETD